jgi:hypothetical protein
MRNAKGLERQLRFRSVLAIEKMLDEVIAPASNMRPVVKANINE